MSKPGFPHHGQFTSVTARKMLSMRGGRASAKAAARDNYAHLKSIVQLSVNVRMRKSCLRAIALLDAKCARVYGCTLLEYLLTRGSDIDSDS